MTKRDNDKLNNLYMEAVQPPLNNSMKEEQFVWVVYEDYGGTSIIGVYTDRDEAEEISNRSNRYYIDSVVLNAK